MGIGIGLWFIIRACCDFFGLSTEHCVAVAVGLTCLVTFGTLYGVHRASRLGAPIVCETNIPSKDRFAAELSIVVPAYNESKRLPSMLIETLKYLDARAALNAKFTAEILVVDDGSRDGTYDVTMDFCRKLRIDRPNGNVRLYGLRLAKNCGKGAAVTAGMLKSVGTHCLLVDADGATRFSDIEKLETAMVKGSYDAAFGSRSDGTQVNRSGLRSFLGWGFNLLIRLLTGAELSDTQCGFKLFRKQCLESVFGSIHLRRWAFDIEVLFLLRRLGMRVCEVPVAWHEVPGSKLSVLTGSMQMLRDVVCMRVLYFFKIWTAKVKQ